MFELSKKRLDTVNDQDKFVFHGSTRTKCSAKIKKISYSNKFFKEKDFSFPPKITTRIESGYLILEKEIEIHTDGGTSMKLDFFYEHNFFGRFLNVEAGKGFDFYFRYSKERYDLIKKGKVKIYLINLKDNDGSLLIENFSILDQEDNPDVRDVFYEDNNLFFLTSGIHYHSKGIFPDDGFKKIIPKEDHIKIPLTLSWLRNFNKSLMIYRQDIENYSEILKITDRKELLEKCSSYLDILNNEEEYLLIYKNQIVNWIEAIETFDENLDTFKKKLFSMEWIERFKLIEFKLGDNPLIDDIPFFNNENILYHKSPTATNNGLSVSSFNKDWKIEKLELIPTKGYQDLSKFWNNWFPSSSFGSALFLSGNEIPAQYIDLDAFLEMFNQKGSTSDIKDMMFSISKEIEEDSEYSLHSNVVFDLQNNLFPYVVVNRDPYSPEEYHCVFTNQNNEFFKLTFDLRYGSATISSHTARDRGYSDGIYHLSLMCLMMIRDFMVPIYREKIFSEKIFKRKYDINKNTYNKKLKVKYVPRIKYKYTDSSKLKSDYQEKFPYRPKSEHSVKGHIRKLLNNQKVSNESLLLARRYGFELSFGTTFVQPHKRGGLTDEQKQIYRSKSLLKEIFINKVSSKEEMSFWFKFEHDVANFFKNQNFKVTVTTPTNDGGKDVEGLDEEGNIVLISCKCYSPDNKIDRSKIDELIGTLTRFKKTQIYDKEKKIRGIFVTTSSYTPGAINAANEGGIELYSGKDLEGIIYQNS